MKFTPNNFLEFVKQVVCGGGPATSGSTLNNAGGGFLNDFPFDLGDVKLGTGTTFVNTSNVPTLSNAATNTDFGTFSWQVPRDYDQQVDTLIVRVLARSAGATDKPVLTVASSTTALGGTVGVAGTSKASAAITNAIAAYEFNLSGQKLVRDTILSGDLTVAAHTTDAIQVFGIQIVYASTLVAWGDSSDVDALGVLLRG